MCRQQVWTWLGPLDRFELVRSCGRSVNQAGEPLSDEELACIVEAHEVGEELLCLARLSEAAEVFELILASSPSDVLAHLKLAVAVLAVHPDKARRLAVALLRHAVWLEPHNCHARDYADMLLRLATGRPLEPWMTTAARVPQSPGMAAAALELLRRSGRK